MRVLHVMGDGEAGGGPTVVLTLTEEMRREGVTVAVATMRDSHLESVCRHRGIEVFGINFAKRTAVFRQRGLFASIYRSFRPDVVHAHGARSMLPLALLPRRRDPAIVYTVHGFHHTAKAPLGRIVGRGVEWYCARRADATIYVGAPQGLSYGQRQSEQMVNKSLSVAAKYIKFRGFVRLDELEVTGSPLVMFHPRSS